MKNKLVETVKFCFTSDVVAQLGALVDETEAGVEKALSKYVPLVLSGLSSRAGRGLPPEELFDLVRDADAANVLKQLAELPGTRWHEQSTNLLLDLLGDSYRPTVSQVATEAGIRPKASGTLLEVATTAVLGVLGRFATDNELSVSDFVYWLHTQKEAIGAAMLRPAGDAGPITVVASPQLLAVPAAQFGTSGAPAAATRRWQWVALTAAVALGAFFGHNLWSSGPQPGPAATSLATNTAPPASSVVPAAAPTTELPPVETQPVSGPATGPATPIVANEPSTIAKPAPPAPATAAPVVAPVATPRAVPQPAPRAEAGGRYDQDRDTYIYDTGRPIVLTLADGTTQKVGANSTENRLYTFLASSAVQVDSVNRTKGWINFDRINFEAGKALLTPESALQLGNVASILNTFPNSVVKIGGYTDSTGDALSNFQLSEDRARAAMLTLTSMGVSPDRLQSKGYGPKYFVRPNNTPTGRALNRRVSIRVLRK